MANIPLTNFDNTNMPSNETAEATVLGCILIEPSCMSTVLIHLKPEHFFLKQHQDIFACMVTMDAAGASIDPLTVLERLKREGVFDEAGGKKYLFDLANSVPNTAHLEQYIKMVKDAYLRRVLINLSTTTIEKVSSEQEDSDLILDDVEQKIYNIRQGRASDGPSKISDIIVNDVFENLKNLSSPDREKYLGIPTGFSELDKTISGLNKSDLILIGARPAMGKTSFALNLASNIALRGKRKVLFFSLEMTKEQLAQRVLSAEACVNSFKMRTGDLSEGEWDSLGTATDALSSCELYFDDTSTLTVPEMKARVRRLKNVDCVIIDYLGLMKSGVKTDNRVNEVGEITRGLKLMAKDLRIPVVVCAQLSRGTEARGKSHRPQLADLRESGSIEQDADIVMMLYRPDYYKNDESSPEAKDDDSIPNLTKLLVVKNRHGEVRDIDLVFNPNNTRFTSLENRQ
ncbi:MAG: replicative DNA helicase [Clostridiales bacterium]|nr:replicative DNA helicase [Clostridiales bacterium]